MPDFNLTYARKIARGGGLLLDIRTLKEYCQGHLCGARLVPTPLPPLQAVGRAKLRQRLLFLLQDVPRNYPILVYCKKGIRAGIAANILRKEHFTRVTVIGGVTEAPLNRVFRRGRKDPFFRVCGCHL
jgi:rhodanese-related sulfurtransferase